MTQEPQIEIRLLEVMGKKEVRTIKEAAKKTGLSRKAISQTINNKTRRMHTDTILKICKGLDCEIGELLVLKKGEE